MFEIFGTEGRVVSTYMLQLRGYPAPVLEHLTGSFAEIIDRGGAMKVAIRCSGNEIVDAVTQLMEKLPHLVMSQETRLLSGRFCKIAHQRRGGIMACAVFLNETL